jgi:hypothetical protein
MARRHPVGARLPAKGGEEQEVALMRGSTSRLTRAAGVAVAATALALALLPSAGAIDVPTTLTFVNHPVNETGIDVNGNHELDPADGWVSNSSLLEDDAVVGHMVSSCQYVKVSPNGLKGSLQCVITAELPEGQITIQGRLVLSPEAEPGLAFAVTGGTESYANVRGSVTGEPIEGSLDSTIIFSLVP